MTKEDKYLLFNDFCARLPYKIKCSYYDICLLAHCSGEIYGIENKEYAIVDGKCIAIGFIKPYLLPMSNMTEEQKVIYNELYYTVIHSLSCNIQEALNELVDWLLKNHFDFRGLIPKGLAIDASNLNVY